MSELIVNEVFSSIDGEVNPWGQGTQTTFVRLTGCNLKCPYCDTPQTQDRKNGMVVGVRDIYADIIRANDFKVTITGGEPLLQRRALNDLLQLLVEGHHRVSIETNGTMEISMFGPAVSWIVDLKLHTKFPIPQNLSTTDWLKIPIRNEDDYIKATRILQKNPVKARIAMSPISPLNPGTLFDWLHGDRLSDIVLNVQLHKKIGLP